MRTALTLDPDVAIKAKKAAAKLHKPFKEVINAALGVGLDEVLKPPAARPYRTKARPLRLRQGFSYDKIGKLLARAEGEDHSLILVEANILLYAEDSLSEHHDAARNWWDKQLSSPDPVALCRPVPTAFIRIVTNVRLHKRPLTQEPLFIFESI